MIYYVVSGTRFRFLCPDPATFFLGSADLQTQSSFSPANFSGQYVINTSANTSAGVSYTLISINANGGNVSTGYYPMGEQQRNCNYASMLPWLDRIFGTHHLPKE